MTHNGHQPASDVAVAKPVLASIKVGLVTNLARPGGNITGLSLQQTDVAGKRLGLLLELSSKSPVVAMIVNPNSPNSAPDISEAQKAASAVGVHLKMFNASTPDELDAAFADENVTDILTDTKSTHDDGRKINSIK